MGEQLDLFAGRDIPLLHFDGTIEDHATDAMHLEPSVDPPAGQLDLFGDRWLRAAAAHRALETFDLEAATAALRDTVALYPSDISLLGRAERVSKLARTLRETPGTRATALVAIEPEVPAFLSTAWNLQVATEIERELGAGGVLDGRPAGYFLLRAGAIERAERSLRATLARDRENGRARGYLGDALTARDQRSEARAEYRDALARSPRTVDLPSVSDVEVRDLPAVAEIDHDVPGDPVDWAAAVGVIEGTFARPHDVPSDWLDAVVLEVLAPGQQFYRWLVGELAARDDAERIACRRAMKALCPSLLKAALDRRRRA